MGCLNKRALLSRLQQLGLASRADLAKSLHMSQPTAGKIVDELLRLEILEEVDSKGQDKFAAGADIPLRVGRPGRQLQLNQSQSRFLGIQLGVSETNLALLTIGSNGEDRWDATLKTPESAEKWVAQLRIGAEKIQQKDFWGVLVSVPGIVDEKKQRVSFSPNLHWTEKADFTSLINKVWQAPVELIQEERALALGHQHAELGGDDFFLVDFGEGVGGAAVVGGKLYTNPLPINGELGHTPVLGNNRPCGCGSVGCLETLVSTRGLMDSFATTYPQVAPSWLALRQRVEQDGIPAWLSTALQATGNVIAGALNVMGLRRVILTGSLADLPASVFQNLSEVIARGALWARFGKVECSIAPRRRTAGLVAVGIDRLLLPINTHDESRKMNRSAVLDQEEKLGVN